ncbi:MAG: hypothetical protein HAW59_05580 [Betaproteobacteria bacterium]|nr:hypothetical protein [Betaproteobacteria bacterium]
MPNRRRYCQTAAAIVKFRPHWAARRRPICIPTLERGNEKVEGRDLPPTPTLPAVIPA